jgi:hypothetical protein
LIAGKAQPYRRESRAKPPGICFSQFSFLSGSYEWPNYSFFFRLFAVCCLLFANESPMPPHKPPPDLIKFLKPYDRAIQQLALSLRLLVLEEMAPCHENIYDAYSAVAIGYGPSDRLKDGVLHIAVYGSGVNLGFNDGATLDDPLRILKGTGKRIRHISIKTSDDLERPEIRSYIRRARKLSVAEARKLGGPSLAAVDKDGKVTSVVKAIYANKRRPASKATSKIL